VVKSINPPKVTHITGRGDKIHCPARPQNPIVDPVETSRDGRNTEECEYG